MESEFKRLVNEFRTLYKIDNVCYRSMSKDDVKNFLQPINEELLEAKEAEKQGDKEQLVKELLDVIYICYERLETCKNLIKIERKAVKSSVQMAIHKLEKLNINILKGFKQLHESNMSKAITQSEFINLQINGLINTLKQDRNIREFDIVYSTINNVNMAILKDKDKNKVIKIDGYYKKMKINLKELENV